MLRPKHVAGLSFFGKRDTDRQRPVWNGSSLSEVAHAPPLPRRLANPACLPHVRVKEGDRLFFSKRDAASFFDALQAPVALRAWFGCPGVKAGELARELGVSLKVLEGSCDDLESSSCTSSARPGCKGQPGCVSRHGNGGSGHLTANVVVYPCITSWPMGFSWSSAM